jgi:putative transposase
LQRSLWYYRTKKQDDEVIEKLQMLAERSPNRGFDDYYGKIRNEGLKWNRKRVLRIYRSLKLVMRRKYKRRLPSRIKQSLQQPLKPNRNYSMDFMSDALTNGRKIRVLNIMDDFTRESLAAYCNFSISGERVVAVLKDIIAGRGKPEQIRVDNGPEFLSKVFYQWCRSEQIEIKYIQPGKPMQNGYVERLNRTFREDVLDAYLFESLEELRIISDEWQEQYNHFHPHQSLGGSSPLNFAKAFRRNFIVDEGLNMSISNNTQPSTNNPSSTMKDETLL